MIRSAALLIATGLMSCSPQAATAPSPTPEAATAAHPVSGLEVIPLSIDTGERTYGFRVEVAATPEARARGLMYRTELADDEGMVFPSPRAQIESFWMRNTPIPLDIIFIAPDRTIINIARETVPYSLESVRSAAPAIAVLEVRGGLTEERGIEPGDRVEW